MGRSRSQHRMQRELNAERNGSTRTNRVGDPTTAAPCALPGEGIALCRDPRRGFSLAICPHKSTHDPRSETKNEDNFEPRLGDHRGWSMYTNNRLVEIVAMKYHSYGEPR